jgi:toxin ParE1/3/4
MEIIWRDAALEDLASARRFIAERNPAAVRRVFAAIITAVEKLPAMPNIGRPGRVTGTRELVVTGTPYIVAYAVIDRQLAVLAVIHGAREWPE